MFTDLAKRSSTVLLASGTVAVLFGILASFLPGLTALTFAVMWGVYALIDGATALGLAFTPQQEKRGWLVFTGVVGVIAGLLVLIRPGLGVSSLAWVLGVWLVIRGITELAAAFAQETPGRKALLALGGLLWTIAGFVIMANPGRAALGLTVWLGILAVCWGVALIAVGFAVRKEAQEAEKKDPSAGEAFDR